VTAENFLRSGNWLLLLVRALAFGAAGGLLFDALNLPLAWMLGPLIANLLMAIGGARVAVPDRLREYFLGVLGLLLGSQVTPQLATRVFDWPLSAALLLVGLAVSTIVGAWWYRRCGFDSITAWFSSAPGAMTAMILMGDKAGGDPRRIAVAQSLRALLIVMMLPPFFVRYASVPDGVVGSVESAQGLWLLLVLPLFIWIGRSLRLPNPALLASMLIAAALGGADIARLHLPHWGVDLMLWVLGSAIGARFIGVKRGEILRYAFQAIVATVLTLAVLAAFAWLIHVLLGIPLHIAILAFAPGGIGEMAILAVTLNIDPVFVTFHHLLRLISLMLVAPLWIHWLRRIAVREKVKSCTQGDPS
jgi:membrane AbrB-like protein